MGWRSLSITLVCVVCLVATSCYPRIGDVRDERQAPTCDSELSELSADPRNCGACGIDCAGEACVSGVCRPKLLASGQTSPRVALDDTHVYWTEFLPSGFVRRTPRNGGAIELIAEGQSYPVGIALDDGAIYWAAKGTGTIAKAEKSAPFPQTQLATGHEAYAVALSNSGDSYLYWLEVGTNSCTPYKVDRTSYALSALPKLEPCGVPFGVAIDELHVYTGTLAMPGEARVYSVSKVTGAFTELAAVDGGFVLGPVIDEAHVYWSDQTGIYSLDKAGGAPVHLTSGVGPIAVDATHVYWVQYQENLPYGLYRAPIVGGETQPLAIADTPSSISSSPGTSIAVHDGAVVWALENGVILTIPTPP